MTVLESKLFYDNTPNYRLAALLSTGRTEAEQLPEASQLFADGFNESNAALNLAFGMREFVTNVLTPEQYNYNAFEQDRQIVESFPLEQRDEFLNSRNPRKTRVIARQLNEQRERLDRLGKAGGFGMFAHFVGAVLSPETLIPVTRLANVARLGGTGFLAGATNVASTAVLAESMAQLALKSNQPGRSTEQMLASVIGATLLGGTLGGTFGAVFRSSQVDALLRHEINNGITGARMREFVSSKDFQGLPAGKHVSALIDELSKWNPDAARLMSEPDSFLRHVWRKGFRAFPGTRLGTSRSQRARIAIRDLDDSPLIRIGDEELGPGVRTNVQAAIVWSQGKLANSVVRVTDIFKEAKLAINEVDFTRHVVDALRSGDEALQAVVDPSIRLAVKTSAKEVRDAIDEIVVGAESVGLMVKKDLKGTAVSYLTRVWNNELVSAKGARLRDEIMVPTYMNRDGMSLKDAQNLADEQIRTILSSNGAVPEFVSDGVGVPSSLQARRIILPDTEIAEYLVNDLRTILSKFSNALVPRVELARRFRTASPAMDVLPGRLENAISVAERTGDNALLLEVVEDAENLAAAAAFTSRLSEDGLAKAKQVEDTISRMPSLRATAKEAGKRAATEQGKVDEFGAAQQKVAQVEEELQTTRFDRMPKSVRKTFDQELAEKQLASQLAAERSAAELSAEASKELTKVRARQRRTARASKGKIKNPERLTRLNDELDSLEAELADSVRAGIFEGRSRAVLESEIQSKNIQIDTTSGRTLARRIEETADAQARANTAKARHAERNRTLKQLQRELRAEPATRDRFFQTWRRWVMSESESLYPATRAALVKFAKGGGKGLAKLGTGYVRAVRHLVAQEKAIVLVRKEAEELGAKSNAADARLAGAEDTLLELRKEAKKTDSSINVKIKTATRTQDLVRLAENSVERVRRRDAMRATNLKHIEDAIIKDYEVEKLANPDKAGALERELQSDLADLRLVRDRLTNKNLMDGRDPTHWALSANRIARRLNFMRAMGGLVLSSFPDIGMHTFVNGFTNTMRTFRTAMKKGLKGLKADDELARTAFNLEMVTGSRAKSFGDVENLANLGRIENAVDKLSEKFTYFTFINNWNGISKALAALGAQHRLLDDIAKVVQGKSLTRSERANLAASGINREAAKAIHAERVAHAQVDRETGQILSNTSEWTDQAARRTFSEAIMGDVRRTIITPSAGDAPRWMSTSTGVLIGQFKTFSMSATSKVLFSGMQRRDAAVMVGAMQMLMLGGAVFALKELTKGRDPFEKPAEEWVFNAVDRSGMFGWFMDVNNILDRTWNAGAGSMLGVGSSTRATARTAMEQLFGPSFGAAFDSIGLSQSVVRGEISERDISSARRLFPGNNLFYLHALVNQLEKGVAAVVVGDNP